MCLEFRCCRVHMFLCCFLVADFFVVGFASDRITSGHSIRGGETLTSSGGKFAFGFFSPNDSANRYAGIWYNRMANRSVVWVANRETPIPENDGVLFITNEGNLLISRNNGQIIWSTTNSTLSSANCTLILDGTGNLILCDVYRILWQSFDHPTDTYLPDMEFRVRVQDGESRVFTSWSGPFDPSPGNYSMGVDTRGPPQIVIWAGSHRRWRSGHWNGLIFTGVPEMPDFYRSGFTLTERNSMLDVTYTPPSPSDLFKFRLGWEGVELQERWIEENREWETFYKHPVEKCDFYNYCGNFGMCRMAVEVKCGCMDGFKPRNGDEWARGNRTGGCVRRSGLGCGPDGFLEVKRVKLPDFVDYVVSLDVRECERICKKNCSWLRLCERDKLHGLVSGTGRCSTV